MRTNEGYEILVSIPVNEHEEIVIGRNYSGRFVVWNCKDGDDYFWGRYVMTYKQALQAVVRKLDLLGL